MVLYRAAWLGGLLAPLVCSAPSPVPAVAMVSAPHQVPPMCSVPVGRPGNYDVEPWSRVVGEAGSVRSEGGALRWSRGLLTYQVSAGYELDLCVAGSFAPGAVYSEEDRRRGPDAGRVDMDMKIRVVGYGFRSAPLPPHEVDAGR